MRRLVPRLVIGSVLLLISGAVEGQEDPSTKNIPTPTAPEFIGGEHHSHAPIVEVYQKWSSWSTRDHQTWLALGKIPADDYFIRPIPNASAISPGTGVVQFSSNAAGDWYATAEQNDPAVQSSIKAFVHNGGILIVDMADNDWSGGFMAPDTTGTPDYVFPDSCNDASLASGALGPDGVLGTADDHPIVKGPDGVHGTADDLNNSNIDMDPSWGCHVVHGNLADGISLPAGATTLMTAKFGGVPKPIVVEYCLGSGLVLVDTFTKEYGGHQPAGSGPSHFMRNLFSYAITLAQHPSRPAAPRPCAPADTDAPIASPTQMPAANAAGWNSSDVVIDWNWTDNESGSGVDVDNCTVSSTSSAEGGSILLNASCKDLAGNTGNASHTVKVDKTKPTIAAAATTTPNGAGWHSVDVTVQFTCSDTLSGIPGGACPGDEILSTEGSGVSSTASVTVDAAGNPSDASNVVTVNIDKTNPVVALSGGPADGTSYHFGAVPATPSCSASDALSGLDSICIVSGFSTTVGVHTVTATAKDKAGNQSSASRTYTVLPWTVKGFYQPVDMNGVWNTVKNGATVPLKFEVFSGSNELMETSIVVQPILASQTLCGGGTVDEIEVLATGATTLRYDLTEGLFIYNWQTPKKPGYCYAVTVKLADGSSVSANIKLR